MNLQVIIFILFIVLTIFTLIIWLWKKKDYSTGQIYDTREVVALYTLPRIITTWAIILLIFYIAELNKLHLLYVMPVMYFIISSIQAKRVVKENKKNKPYEKTND